MIKPLLLTSFFGMLTLVLQGQDVLKVGSNKFIHTAGTQSLYIGNTTGASSTGSHNTFVGQGSGLANTTANFNTFFGANSGYRNNTGINNTFIGSLSGESNTGASNNTFVGMSAGYLTTTGSQNAFFGTNAGRGNVTGTDNTMLGSFAGEKTTSSGNTFVGNRAGWQTTTAGNGTFIGNYAGATNTIGSENVFIGHNAGYENRTGTENTFVGTQAGSASNQGSYNTLLGKGAGYGNTTGSNNTFVGRNAGFANVTGSNNIFLGNESIPVGSNADNLQNVVAIGAYAKVAISDAIILGDTANANIKVGIGTAAPRYPLDVKGSINIRRGAGGVGKLLFASRSSISTDEQDYLVLTGGQPGESGLQLSNLTGPIKTLPVINHVLAADEQGRVGRYRVGVEADQVRLQVASAKQWPDFVFTPFYSAMPLDQLSQYVQKYRRLPGFPSAQEMSTTGASVESLIVNLVKTQEEQARYLIQLKAENDQLREDNKAIRESLKHFLLENKKGRKNR